MSYLSDLKAVILSNGLSGLAYDDILNSLVLTEQLVTGTEVVPAPLSWPEIVDAIPDSEMVSLFTLPAIQVLRDAFTEGTSQAEVRRAFDWMVKNGLLSGPSSASVAYSMAAENALRPIRDFFTAAFRAAAISGATANALNGLLSREITQDIVEESVPLWQQEGLPRAPTLREIQKAVSI